MVRYEAVPLTVEGGVDFTGFTAVTGVTGATGYYRLERFRYIGAMG